MDRVLVTRTPPGRALDMLQASAALDVWAEERQMPRGELLQRVAPVDGLYCMLTDRIDEELLDAAPRLRVVSTMAVGIDNIDLAACTQRGVIVGHTPDVLTETTADTAFTLMAAAARRVGEGIAYVEEGRWKRWEPDLLLGSDIHGTTLGIIGLGRIGRAVAKRARGFDMQILYHNRSRDTSAEDELGAEYRSFADLLQEADHVIVLVPLSDETHHLIDAAALAMMKPTATLTNAARGPIVNPVALADALRSGTIAAAALDVTDPEPIPADDQLLDLPNCIVIPHLGSASVATRAAMAELAAENLIAGLRGEPLPARAGPG